MDLNTLPMNHRELALIAIDLPVLEDNRPESCPEPLTEVHGYVQVETGADIDDHGEFSPINLTFVRTARIGSASGWLWRFVEPFPGGRPAYVAVLKSASGETFTIYESFDEDLTPEQFLVWAARRLPGRP